MATLTIVDQKDGSGALVSISGITGTAVLSTAYYRGDVVNNLFVNQITTAVDVVDQLVAFPVGSHIAVITDDTGPKVSGFRVTDAEEGIHHRCLTAIRDFLIAMNLPSFPTDSTKFKVHKKPLNTFEELVAVAGDNIQGVHLWKRPEEFPRVGNNRDWDVTYPIEMVLVRSNRMDNRAIAANRGGSDTDWTYDRERILRAIGECPLEEVPEVFVVDVQPGTLYGNDTNLGVDSQSLKFLCRSYVPFAFA